MKFEVVEDSGSWIVRRDGAEIARHREQEQALADVAKRLGDAGEGHPDLSYSLAMRYQTRD
jgi:hypothetical protein